MRLLRRGFSTSNLLSPTTTSRTSSPSLPPPPPQPLPSDDSRLERLLDPKDCTSLGRIVCCWLVGCLTSQQHASVPQGRICEDNFACCHTEIEVADPIFFLTQSQYTDSGPTSPSIDPIMPGAWQGSHWSAHFEVIGMTRPGKHWVVNLILRIRDAYDKLGLFVGCLTSQQHVSVSQGRICSDKFTCCHTEIEVADQTFYLTQSQYTDTGPTSPIADPITPGAWQGSHRSANF